MKRILMTAFSMMFVVLMANAQGALKKVYDETIDPMQQIDEAVSKAKAEDKFVVCQVGGNWCPWCLRFADFVEKDTAVNKVVNDNFVYIHVNYNRRKAAGDGKGCQAHASPGQSAAFWLPCLRGIGWRGQGAPHPGFQLSGGRQGI